LAESYGIAAASLVMADTRTEIHLKRHHFGASAGTISVNGVVQDGTPTWGAVSIINVGIPNTGTDSGSIVLTKSDTKTSTPGHFLYLSASHELHRCQRQWRHSNRNDRNSRKPFGTSGGNAQILINTAIPSATTPVWSATSITNVDIPNAGAISGVIKVTNPQTTKLSNDSAVFYIYPEITSVFQLRYFI